MIANTPRIAIDTQPSTMPAMAMPRPFSRPWDRAILPSATLPKITARMPVTIVQKDASPSTSAVTENPFVRCCAAGPMTPGGDHGALGAGAGGAHAALGMAGIDGSPGVVTRESLGQGFPGPHR